MSIKTYIRTIPHYPKQGVMFRDITTLLKNADGFHLAINDLTKHCEGKQIDYVAGIDARGFIIGAALAYRLGVGFLPIRKKGKLPAETIGYDYELEYGSDRVEMHVDAISPDDKILLIDDLIATGGTAEASCKLIQAMGGSIVACGFLIDLPDLGGSGKLRNMGLQVFSLCEFEGD